MLSSLRPLCAALALCALPAAAALLEGLPGREVVLAPRLSEPVVGPDADRDSAGGVLVGSSTWIAPPVHLQLSRDPGLATIGKGEIFVPTYSEARREPEVSVLRGGVLAASGQTGVRIQVDSGNYEVRFGSGVGARRLRTMVQVTEGHTTVVEPTWSGLIVETLSETGEYIDGQYDLIRMDPWVNYGRGRGYTEERLQDIESWILPPGLYRISKVGEGYNSLLNYITVQVNPGELHTVELIFDEETGNLIAGGIKSLNTRARAGRYWSYGLRAGGNAALTRTVSDGGEVTQSQLFSTDLRLRARYDRESIFGISELFLQNSFTKNEGEPLLVTQDFVQLRSTWVRRLNDWIGPYVRGQASTHFFPIDVDRDTVRLIDLAGDTSVVATGGTFERQPAFFPVALAQGVGVNVEWLSDYAVELSTQTGLAFRQDVSRGDYLSREIDLFEVNQSSYSVGAEGILIAKLRLSSQFTLDLRAEAFAEDANLRKTRLENLEADFRFFLTRNIEVGYLFQMQESLAETANRFPRTHSLSLRLSFNY